MENATHSVSLGGETHLVNADNFKSVCDDLVARHGGMPDVKPVVTVGQSISTARDLTQRLETIEAQLPPVVINDQTGIVVPVDAVPVARGEGHVDAAGLQRSLDNEALAKANGFAPKQPVYARGTRVVQWGVDNARLSRVEHEAKPLTEKACVEFIQRIALEQRADEVVPFAQLRMRDNGLLAHVPVEGSRGTNFGPMTDRGFRSLLGQADIGGHQYLASVPPVLRAINVNHHLAGKNGLVVPEGSVKLRTRRTQAVGSNGVGREIFGVVSPRYTAFDADKVAAEIIQAVEGTEARGSVLYDGERARFEAIWHADVQPEDYVAGEFFKAGIVVRTADDGSGSCRVSAVVWQNLCLNLIIIDEADQEIARLRHVGAADSMAAKLRAAMETAKSKVAGFVKKWGYACREDLLRTPGIGVLSIEEAIPGFFNGVIERELVPVRGKRQDVVRSLVSMVAKDQSSATNARGVDFSRAALVNAFTRWAHEVNTDPWLEDEVQRAAGRLVQSVQALPFEPISLEG